MGLPLETTQKLQMVLDFVACLVASIGGEREAILLVYIR